MKLSREELLELEINEAWQVFCDADPDHHAETLKIVDPKRYKIIELAYAHGFADGAQSVYRGLDHR